MPFIHSFLTNVFRAERLLPNLQGTGAACPQGAGGISLTLNCSNNNNNNLTCKHLGQEPPDQSFVFV